MNNNTNNNEEAFDFDAAISEHIQNLNLMPLVVEPTKINKKYYGKDALGKEFIFKEAFIEGNGDCGFTALDISREDITAMLLSLSRQEDIQELYGTIIQSALLNKEWQYNQKEWEQLNHALTQSENALKPLTDELFAYYAWNSFVDDKKGETLESRYEAFLDLLDKMYEAFIALACDKNKNFGMLYIYDQMKQFNLPQNQWPLLTSITDRKLALEHSKKTRNDMLNLQEKIRALKNITEARERFCKNEAILMAYAMDFSNDTLKKKLWLDMTSMILYANHNQIKLFIWEETRLKKNGKKVLRIREESLLNKEMSKVAVSVKHVLFSKGIHFSQLMDISHLRKPTFYRFVSLSEKHEKELRNISYSSHDTWDVLEEKCRIHCAHWDAAMINDIRDEQTFSYVYCMTEKLCEIALAMAEPCSFSKKEKTESILKLVLNFMSGFQAFARKSCQDKHLLNELISLSSELEKKIKTVHEEEELSPFVGSPSEYYSKSAIDVDQTNTSYQGSFVRSRTIYSVSSLMTVSDDIYGKQSNNQNNASDQDDDNNNDSVNSPFVYKL